MSKIKFNVFIVCTGLGRVSRGFETFSQECFDVLKDNQSIEFYLLKGGRRSDSEKKVYSIWNIPRYSFLGKISRKGYYLEQITFLMGMLPYVLSLKPDAILYSDALLGSKLALVRKAFRLDFKLILSNGAPNFPPFPHSDFVQHLLPSRLKSTLDYGEDANRHFLLPYGFHLNKSSEHSLSEKNELRDRLNLPKEKIIIISVGAINNNHKRMGFLIEEVASLGNEHVFLLILGQKEKESQEIINSGMNLLGTSNFLATTVHPSLVHSYLLASDLFVLSSLSEGFGRVLIEAQHAGLPTLVHNAQIFHEVLEEFGIYMDMKVKGSLKTELKKIIEQGTNKYNAQERKIHFYNKYDWSNLKDQYLKMFFTVLAN